MVDEEGVAIGQRKVLMDERAGGLQQATNKSIE